MQRGGRPRPRKADGQISRGNRELDGWMAMGEETGGRADQGGGRATLLMSCLCLGCLFEAPRHVFLKDSTVHYIHTNALSGLVIKYYPSSFVNQCVV